MNVLGLDNVLLTGQKYILIIFIKYFTVH